jgi:hypothetical protein
LDQLSVFIPANLFDSKVAHAENCGANRLTGIKTLNTQVPGDGVAANGFLFPSKAIASIQKPVPFSRQMVQPVQ